MHTDVSAYIYAYTHLPTYLQYITLHYITLHYITFVHTCWNLPCGLRVQTSASRTSHCHVYCCAHSRAAFYRTVPWDISSKPIFTHRAASALRLQPHETTMHTDSHRTTWAARTPGLFQHVMSLASLCFSSSNRSTCRAARKDVWPS